MTKNTVSTIIEIFSLEQIDMLINTYFSRLEILLQFIVALAVLVVFFTTTLRRKDKKRVIIPYVIMTLLYCLRLVTLVPKINPDKIPTMDLSRDVETIKNRNVYYRSQYETAVNSLEKVANDTSFALQNIKPQLINNHETLVEQTDKMLGVIQIIKQKIQAIFDHIDNLVAGAEKQLKKLQEKKNTKKKTIQKYKKNNRGELVVSSPSSTSMVTAYDDNSIKYSAFKKSTLDATEKALKQIQVQLQMVEMGLDDIISNYNNDLPRNDKITKDFLDRTIQKLNQKNTTLDSMQAKIFKFLEKPLLYATENLDESTEKLIISVLDSDSSVIETLSNEVIGSLPTSWGNIGKQYRVRLNPNNKAFPVVSTIAVDAIIAFDQKMLLALLFAINGGMMFSNPQQQEAQTSIQVQQVSKQQFQRYKQQLQNKNKRKLLLDM